MDVLVFFFLVSLKKIKKNNKKNGAEEDLVLQTWGFDSDRSKTFEGGVWGSDPAQAEVEPWCGETIVWGNVVPPDQHWAQWVM